jgi:hypothetical protein
MGVNDAKWWSTHWGISTGNSLQLEVVQLGVETKGDKQPGWEFVDIHTIYYGDMFIRYRIMWTFMFITWDMGPLQPDGYCMLFGSYHWNCTRK